MRRYTDGFVAMIVACTVVATSHVAYSDVADDAIGSQLEQARVAYQEEMKTINDTVTDLLAKKEAAARKIGNKPLVDSTKIDREAFEKAQILPALVPVTLRRKQASVRAKLEKEYETAIKDYTRKSLDSDAKKLETELKDFQNEPVLAAIKSTLLGTWKLKCGDYVADLTFQIDGTVKYSKRDIPYIWKIDLDAGYVLVNFPENRSDKFKLPLNEKETSGLNISGLPLVITKQK